MNCWEFMKCAPTRRDSCPAHPEKGKDCWKVTGTKCNGGLMETKTLAEKIDYCKHCGFYKEHAHKF